MPRHTSSPTRQPGGDGGAICNYEGELTIAGSHFINNTASFNGGAIRIGGKSTVTNCNFTNNTVNKYYGGAIYADEESTVTDCNFVDNHADNYSGGAIFFYYKGNVTNSCTET